MGLIFGFLAKLLPAFLLGWLRDRQSNTDAKALGASQAGNETLEEIVRTADARANMDPVSTDPRKLSRELRDAAGTGGGDHDFGNR